jgi:hypothetical protein
MPHCGGAISAAAAGFAWVHINWEDNRAMQRCQSKCRRTIFFTALQCPAGVIVAQPMPPVPAGRRGEDFG